MTSLRTFLPLVCFFLLKASLFAQNVTITPDGITPALASSYQRLTYDAIIALPSPNDGDIAYDVTFKCMRLYNGTKWVRLISDDLNNPSVTGWAAGGIGMDAGISIVTDSSKNIFVTGYFKDTATFNGIKVVSAGESDIFIVKYHNSGLMEWVKTAGGPSDDFCNDITVDGSGNIYITGTFQGIANFDTIALTSMGAEDFFIAKYDNLGNFQWVQRSNGTQTEVGVDIFSSISGDIYVAGFFYDTATFSGTSIISSGGSDIFIAKYDTAGVLQWIQKTGGNNMDFSYTINVDASDFVYLTGIYVNGSTKIGTTTLSNSGATDIILAKYDPSSSTWLWAKKIGGSGNDAATGTILDNNGNIYLTGYFANTLNFGGSSISSYGNLDAFVAKFDSSGNFVWARKAGGTNEDTAHDIDMDTQGNIYITGFFIDSANFQATNISSAGDADIFVAKYNNNGALIWVQRMGNIGIDKGMDLAVDSAKNIYVTGTFQENVKFGNADLISTGSGDIFITKLVE